MSQARHQAIKDVADRADAYGIPGLAIDGNDVFAVYEAVGEAVKRARSGMGPTLIECKTYRQRGHFEGDAANYKPEEEQKEWLKKDPLPRILSLIKENEVMADEEIAKLDADIAAELEEAVRFAEESPYPTLESSVEDIYSDIIEEVRSR